MEKIVISELIFNKMCSLIGSLPANYVMELIEEIKKDAIKVKDVQITPIEEEKKES